MVAQDVTKNAMEWGGIAREAIHAIVLEHECIDLAKHTMTFTRHLLKT